HTFNSLFDSRQQIIMTCDRYPREVDGLEPRLKSRLAWGLSVAIDPPDFETRAAIVLAKARERGTVVPDEVAFLLAKQMRSNVRALEGPSTTRAAPATSTGRACSAEAAQETRRALLRARRQPIGTPNTPRPGPPSSGFRARARLPKGPPRR